MRTRRLNVLGPACFVLALGVSAPAMAGGDAGCGLGSILWNGQKGMVFNLFASTTNGVLGTQTAGITFGTSGCTRGTVVALEHRLELFIGSNADELARDMALGEGETLTMLASLMEVAEADRAAFYQLTQQSVHHHLLVRRRDRGRRRGVLAQGHGGEPGACRLRRRLTPRRVAGARPRPPGSWRSRRSGSSAAPPRRRSRPVSPRRATCPSSSPGPIASS